MELDLGDCAGPVFDVAYSLLLFCAGDGGWVFDDANVA